MCVPKTKQWQQRMRFCHAFTKVALIIVPCAHDYFSSIHYDVMHSGANTQAFERAQYADFMQAQHTDSKWYGSPEAMDEIDSYHGYVHALAAHDLPIEYPIHAAAAFDLMHHEPHAVTEGVIDWHHFLCGCSCASAPLCSMAFPISWGALAHRDHKCANQSFMTACGARMPPTLWLTCSLPGGARSGRKGREARRISGNVSSGAVGTVARSASSASASGGTRGASSSASSSTTPGGEVELFQKLATEAAAKYEDTLGCRVRCEYMGQPYGPKSRRQHRRDPSEWRVPALQWRSQQAIEFRWDIGGVETTSVQLANHVKARGVRCPDVDADRTLTLLQSAAARASAEATETCGYPVVCTYMGQAHGKGSKRGYRYHPNEWRVPDGHWRSQQEVTLSWATDGDAPGEEVTTQLCNHVLARGVAVPERFQETSLWEVEELETVARHAAEKHAQDSLRECGARFRCRHVHVRGAVGGKEREGCVRLLFVSIYLYGALFDVRVRLVLRVWAARNSRRAKLRRRTLHVVLAFLPCDVCEVLWPAREQ